jgi:hypothetical protein
VWQPFIPEVDIASLEEAAVRPGGTPSPRWRRRVAVCRFLIERWPQEARDTVRVFPGAQWQLLQLVNLGGAPGLELLRSNPALGYLAATAGAAGQLGLRRRSLAALFGFPETEHAVRLLRKVHAAWISSELLEHLRAAMVEQRDAEAVLTHLEHINPIALQVACDADLRASVAPACLARFSRVPAPVSQCDLIARMRDLVGTARSRALPPPRIRSLADLDRPPAATRVPARAPRPSQGKALTFPPPPLPDCAAAGVRICAIDSQQDLAGESRVMDHCAGRDASYARRVASGQLYFYRMLEPERLTIAIRPALQGWTVEQIRGAHNREPRAASRMLVEKWLRPSDEPSCTVPDAAPAPPRLVFGAGAPRTIRLVRRRFPCVNQLALDFT